jgi:hypothetical protein
MLKRRMAMVLAGALMAGGATFGAGTAGATNIGNEGCTPGYWKNHTENWQEHPTTARLGRQFTFPDSLAHFRDVTFLQALQGGGGPGLDGATKILMRASVAAFLNAAHEGLGYPYRRYNDPFNIQSQVNAALASQDRDQILALASTLDAANNLGCPLN